MKAVLMKMQAQWQDKLHIYLEKYQPQLEKLKSWWSQLAVREQQAVMIGSSVVSVFLIYACLWNPLQNHITHLRSEINNQQKMLIWMQAADKEIQKIQASSGAKTKHLTPVVLLGFLQKQINQQGLSASLTQLKEVSNDSVAMHFQKVVFDNFLQLMTTVIKQQNVSISQLSATPNGAPGVADVDITLKVS